MEQKDLFKLVFYGLLGSMAIYLLMNYPDIQMEDMFVAFGTAILALFTWHLALTETEDSKQTRQLMIDEARRERRRLRLKEQLEGLYSPLMAHIDNFDPKFPRSNHFRGIKGLMQDIKNKYQYLATPELRELFLTYYHPDTRTLTPEQWSKFIYEVGQTIYNEYESLTKEYNELTIQIPIVKKEIKVNNVIKKNGIKRFEILLGVFIGLYGNWLISVGQMLLRSEASWEIFGLSLIFLFVSCSEATILHWNYPRRLLAHLSSFIHISLIYVIFKYQLGTVKNNFTYLIIGILLWTMFHIVAIRLGQQEIKT